MFFLRSQRRWWCTAPVGTYHSCLSLMILEIITWSKYLEAIHAPHHRNETMATYRTTQTQIHLTPNQTHRTPHPTPTHFLRKSWPSSLPAEILIHVTSSQHPGTPHLHSALWPTLLLHKILTHLAPTQYRDPPNFRSSSWSHHICTQPRDPPHFHAKPWSTLPPLNILTHVTSTQHSDLPYFHTKSWPTSPLLNTLTHLAQYRDPPNFRSSSWW